MLHNYGRSNARFVSLVYFHLFFFWGHHFSLFLDYSDHQLLEPLFHALYFSAQVCEHPKHSGLMIWWEWIRRGTVKNLLLFYILFHVVVGCVYEV